MDVRKATAGLAASLGLIAAIAQYEGFRAEPYIPLAGDVATIGYGTTTGVTMNSAPVTKVEALKLLRNDVSKFEGAIKSCVRVPLYQYEYDAYTSLSYNIGGRAFCHSTLVKSLNRREYSKACSQILRWNRFDGRVLRGLSNRRRDEYQRCTGAKQ